MSLITKICRVFFWITAAAVASIPLIVFFIIMSGRMDFSSAMGSSVILLVAAFTSVYATYAICLAAPLMLIFWWFGFRNKTDSANKVFVVGVLAGAFPFAFSFVVPVLSVLLLLLSIAFSPGSNRHAITQASERATHNKNIQPSQNRVVVQGGHPVHIHVNPDGSMVVTPVGNNKK